MEGGPPPGIIKTYVEEGEQKANKTSGSITKNQENKSKFPLLGYFFHSRGGLLLGLDLFSTPWAYLTCFV